MCVHIHGHGHSHTDNPSKITKGPKKEETKKKEKGSNSKPDAIAEVEHILHS